MGKELETAEEHDYKQDFSKDENEERGNWSGRLDFLLSCLGYAVGLGNVWRFPYLCYKNGGAVFFIPYTIMLFFVGMPIFFMELSLGQFSGNSALTCWDFAPIFKGIGVAMVIVSALVGIYYNMIIAWALYYLVASFTALPGLPWDTCGSWSGTFCSDKLDPRAVNCTELLLNASSNGVCYNGTKVFGIWNETIAANNSIKPVAASEDYFNNVVLERSSGIEETGQINWKLVLSLLGGWIIVFLALCKGIKSSGKVVYFTALFPYVMLVILLVNGLLLPNYYEGIRFYILEPDISKLANAAVWKDAAVQIFFSLSASWGGLITLASYNRFHNDALRDSLIVSLGNCLTSFFAGFVIFSYLGFLAGKLGLPLKDVVDSGPGLAFIVYPSAVTLIPPAPMWAIFFFLMLITLGLDSEFALVETVTTSIIDQWPHLRKKKTYVILGVCVVFFILGLTLCTNSGAYWLNLMDHYSGGWNVLVIALLECLAIAYVYGYCRYKEDVRIMIGNTPCCCVPWNICFPWWGLCWYLLTPLGVLFILLFSWVDYSPAKYGSYEYPMWADSLGWLMTLAVVVSIFITGGIMVFWSRGHPERTLFKPNKFWGPALVKHRKLVTYVENFEVDPWNDMDIHMNEMGQKTGLDNPGYN